MGKQKIKEGGFLLDDVCGVYLIISPSGRRYVGSSINIRERWASYRQLKKDKRSISLINSSMLKYGYSNHFFKVLYICLPIERLMWERVFGDLYLSLSDFGGLNLNLPGYDDKPKVISKETKEKMSLSRLIPDREEAAKRDKENRSKNKKKWRERNKKPVIKYVKTEKEIQRSREYGKNRAQDTAWINMMRDAQAKYFSIPENRLKAAETTRRQFQDPKQREIAKTRANRIFGNPETHPRSKKIINIDTGEIFVSGKLVAGKIGMNPAAFRERLRGDVTNNTPFRYLTA